MSITNHIIYLGCLLITVLVSFDNKRDADHYRVLYYRAAAQNYELKHSPTLEGNSKETILRQ